MNGRKEKLFFISSLEDTLSLTSLLAFFIIRNILYDGGNEAKSEVG